MIKKILISLCLVLVTTICTGCFKEKKELPETDTSVSFETIYKEYKANKVRGNEKYKDKRYRITAKINGMKPDGKGANLTMEKKIGNTIAFFYAEFEDDQKENITQVNVGDIITFDGTCNGWGQWTDCKLIK